MTAKPINAISAFLWKKKQQQQNLTTQFIRNLRSDERREKTHVSIENHTQQKKNQKIITQTYCDILSDELNSMAKTIFSQSNCDENFQFKSENWNVFRFMLKQNHLNPNTS